MEVVANSVLHIELGDSRNNVEIVGNSGSFSNLIDPTSNNPYNNGNTLYGLLTFIRNRASILLSAVYTTLSINEKEPNQWMYFQRSAIMNRLIIQSQEPCIFYYISLKSYMSSMFINIYSNTKPADYQLPFIMLYNEYCNSLYFHHIHGLMESGALYVLSFCY